MDWTIFFLSKILVRFRCESLGHHFPFLPHGFLLGGRKICPLATGAVPLTKFAADAVPLIKIHLISSGGWGSRGSEVGDNGINHNLEHNQPPSKSNQTIIIIKGWRQQNQPQPLRVQQPLWREQLPLNRFLPSHNHNHKTTINHLTRNLQELNEYPGRCSFYYNHENHKYKNQNHNHNHCISSQSQTQPQIHQKSHRQSLSWSGSSWFQHDPYNPDKMTTTTPLGGLEHILRGSGLRARYMLWYLVITGKSLTISRF